MRNLKRVLSLALALVMVLGMMVITTSAADYTDAESIKYEEAVEVMSEIGILDGNPDGSFNPKGTLTREQAAKILAFVCLGTDADDYLTGSAAPFDDVAATKWSAKYIAFCKNAKIINGVGDNKFNPAGTLTTVQFAKMLLVAVGIDGEYTGSGWEANVKQAAKDNGLDVITIDTTDITREEACELALAAMKWSTTPEVYNIVKDGKTVVKTFDDIFDAYLYAEILGDKYEVKEAQPTDTLLAGVYKINYERSVDAFDRPGYRYTDKTTEGKKVNLFFADEPVAEYEGTVKGAAVYADLGSPKTINIDCIQVDGYKYAAYNDEAEAAIAEKSKTDVPFTGESVVTEIYEVAENTYTIVVINVFADTVKTVNPAKGETKANIVLTAAADLNTIETADFAEKDAVVYTKAYNATAKKYDVQTIEKLDTIVEGTPTKNANGVYTIGGETYVVASTAADAVKPVLGTEGKWYADSFGNLIATVGKAPTAKATVYYGYLLEYANQKYSVGTGSLLEEGKVTEAAEKFKFVDANGDTVILDGALKVKEKDDGSFDTTFVAESDWTKDTKNVLFAYELDEDGKISKASDATSTPNTSISVTKGKATLSGSEIALTADTLFFYVNAQGKTSVYTGYANAPTATGTLAARYYEGEVGNYVMQAVLLTDASVGTAAPKANYVYFADDIYTEEWDAEANDGKGAAVVVYENIYINGVKAVEGLKFDKVQSVEAGAVYTYTVSSTTDLAEIKSTVVAADATGTEITLIQDTYFKAGTTVYTDEDTAFWQIDTENGTIEVVEALPALSKEYTVNALAVVEGEEAATLVIFTTVDA